MLRFVVRRLLLLVPILLGLSILVFGWIRLLPGSPAESLLGDRVVGHKSALARIQEKVFGGSRELLLTELLGDAKLNASELRRLRHFVGDQQ